MSKRVLELFLFDILIAILKIEKVAGEFDSPEALHSNFMAWDCIIREFEVIGESTKILIQKKLLAPEYQLIVDFRNFLIHQYFGVDAEEVWDVIQNDLVEFKKVILEKIQQTESNLKKELISSLIEENKHYEFIISFLQTI